MRITILEAVYNLLNEKPDITNPEIAEILDISSDNVKTYISRLKSYGYIDTHLVEGKRVVEILKPYRISNNNDDLTSFKQTCYKEMIDVLMEDFRACSSHKDRIEVGNVIRLLMKEF